MNVTVERLSNQELVNILSYSKNAIAVYTTEDIIVEMATDAMIAFWKKDRSVLHKPLLEGVPELEGQPFIEILKNVWRSGISYEAKEVPALLNDNGELKTYYFDFEYRLLKNDDGSPLCILHTASDSTDRVTSRQLSELNETQLRALEREQLLNEELAVTNEELSATNEELHVARETLDKLNAELEQRVTQRTLELSQSEERFRNMMNLAPVSLIITRGDNFVVEACNQTALEVLGQDASIIGKPGFESMPELIGQPIEKRLREVYETGIEYAGYEYPMTILKDGKPYNGYYNIFYKPLLENGKVTGILQSGVEVTEQVLSRLKVQTLNDELLAINEKLSEANDELHQAHAVLLERNNQLQRSEEYNRLATQASDMGTYAINTRTFEFTSSERLRELFGFDKDYEMSYTDCIRQIRDDFRPRVKRMVDDVVQNGGRFEMEYPILCHNDGSLRWLRGVGTMQYDGVRNESYFTGCTIDITNFVKSNLAIKENEERLRLIIESANLGTWYIDAETREFIPSARLKELFGFRLDEKMTYDAAINQIPDEYREAVVQKVELAITQNLQYDLEYPIIGYHDKKLRWIRATGKLFITEDGKKGTFSGTATDITERKQDEQRKNDFIGMVSHEMKTPLTSMSLYLQMLESNNSSAEGNINTVMLNKAKKQVSKMTKLINGFLNVSRLEAGKIHIEKQRFAMANLFKEAEEEARSTINSHQIVFEPVEVFDVVADREKISQVINNLISNAVKYSPANSIIEVSCQKQNNRAIVRVRDYGIGIKPEDIEKLFERYYRVDDSNIKSVAGFGIGLYLCSEIIQRHDGKIWVESEVDKGSTFYFSLPVTSSD